MAIRIEPAREADLATLIDMMTRLYAEEWLPFPRGSSAALDLLMREPSLGRCLVLWEGARPLGYLVLGFGFSLEFGGRDDFLDELYVIPAARGRALGKQALDRAIQVCRAEGIGALHLEVGRQNAAAQHLYRSAGFRERHPDYDLLTLKLEPSMPSPADRV